MVRLCGFRDAVAGAGVGAVEIKHGAGARLGAVQINSQGVGVVAGAVRFLPKFSLILFYNAFSAA